MRFLVSLKWHLLAVVYRFFFVSVSAFGRCFKCIVRVKTNGWNRNHTEGGAVPVGSQYGGGNIPL